MQIVKNLKSILSVIASFAGVMQLSAATVDYGYSAAEPVQFVASAYRTTNYAVIHIPAEIAAKYTGASVTGVKLLCQTYTLGNTEVNTVEAFVAENIENFEAVVSKSSVVEGKIWSQVTFDEPYVITGDKDVYVGYSMKSNSGSETLPVALDAGPATRYGDIMGYSDSRGNIIWEHAGDSDCGNVLVKAVIEGDDMPAGDIMLLSAFGIDVVKPGDMFSVSGLSFNYGSTPVESYDLSCRFGGNEVKSVKFEKGLAAGTCTGYSIDLSLEEEKEAELAVVPVVAGKELVSLGYTVDCTSTMLPRKVLVEEFSTARCGNCPSAHAALASVSKERDDMIVVAHHSGYSEDIYTTDFDRAYLWFYQTGSWAPAFMMDRVNFADQGALAQTGMTTSPSPGPVFIISGADDLKEFVDLAADRYAWLDVNIDYTYDPSTRKLDVEVSGTPVKVFDSWTNPVVNIFLVERSDVSYQEGGGAKYTHRHIFRTSLTGNYGESIALEKGKPYSYKASVVIDDKLDAGDLDIVAFVSNNNTLDANDCEVFNSASVAIDTPSTGIDSVTGASFDVKGGDGVIGIEGDFSNAAIYALNGMTVAELDRPGEVAVEAGVYLVKASVDGNLITRKIIVK